MRILKAADHRRMPWKNGGGETIEIAVHPPGADLDAFEWRISMARVAGDGPFSVFAGIDRTLCILAGAGMALDIEGHGRHSLVPGSAPLAFPADAPTVARLGDGAITDLNVMTRRGVCRHRVTHVVVGDGESVTADAPFFLVPLGPCRIAATDGKALDLAMGDVVLAEHPGETFTVHADGGLPAYRAEIMPGA